MQQVILGTSLFFFLSKRPLLDVSLASLHLVKLDILTILKSKQNRDQHIDGKKQ